MRYSSSATHGHSLHVLKVTVKCTPSLNVIICIYTWRYGMSPSLVTFGITLICFCRNTHAACVHCFSCSTFGGKKWKMNTCFSPWTQNVLMCSIKPCAKCAVLCTRERTKWQRWWRCWWYCWCGNEQLIWFKCSCAFAGVCVSIHSFNNKNEKFVSETCAHAFTLMRSKWFGRHVFLV